MSETKHVLVPEVYEMIGRRKEKFSAHLRNFGIEPNEATFLRHSSYALTDIHLGLDAVGAPEPVVNESRMCADFVITTYNKDRYGDVVIPKGCVGLLKNYRKNPRVFFAHKSNDLPVGSCRYPDTKELALKFFDDKILGTVFFHGETPESEVVFRLVARKELQAASIGFLPVKAAVFEPEKTPERPETDEKGDDLVYFREDPYFKPLRFYEWELLEWSVVSLPANAECLAEHLSRGHVEGEKIPASLKKALEPYAAGKKVQLGYVPPPNKEMKEDKEILPAADPQQVWDAAPPGTTASPESTELTGVEEVPSEVVAKTDTPVYQPPLPEDEYKGWPLGAKFLNKCVKGYGETEKWVREMDQELDQPRVKKFAARKIVRLGKMLDQATKLGAKLYPDRFEYKESEEKETPRGVDKDLFSAEFVAELNTQVSSLAAEKTSLLEENKKLREEKAILENTLAKLLEDYAKKQKEMSDFIFSKTGKRFVD